MVAWLDELIFFPPELDFLKYCILGVLVVISVCLAFGFIASTFSAVFNRK